jgi:SAM-dependent methyltransferase
MDGALAFAVLHHLPGMELRRRVLLQVHDLLVPGGWFIHSEWQFQHSPRLMARRLPWTRLGLQVGDLEEGDTLLDWRHASCGQAEQVGLRYVHLFSRAELQELAALSGFRIAEEFESDGKGGNLGLYQVWRSV